MTFPPVVFFFFLKKPTCFVTPEQQWLSKKGNDSAKNYMSITSDLKQLASTVFEEIRLALDLDSKTCHISSFIMWWVGYVLAILMIFGRILTFVLGRKTSFLINNCGNGAKTWSLNFPTTQI